MQKELLEIGKIVNTHGIKGELKLLPHEDDPGTCAASNRSS